MNTIASLMPNIWVVPSSGYLTFLAVRPVLNWIDVLREQHRIYTQYRMWR